MSQTAIAVYNITMLWRFWKEIRASSTEDQQHN